MTSTLSPPTHANSVDDNFPTVVKLGPADAETIQSSSKRPSRGRRALRAFARSLITLGIGIGGTLAWQSYGDQARQIIADSSPQLGWLAAQTALAHTAPRTVPPAAPTTPSPDLQQQLKLKVMALDLGALRQSIDELAAQLATGQQQMAGDITKLQADQQDILKKISAPPPRPAAVPARKPVPLTPQSPPPQAQSVH